MRLSTTPPAYCSACFNQDPQAIHVDMDAAWDGPVPQMKGDGFDAVAIDDLVLCEACVRSAAGLLPEFEPIAAEYEALQAEYRNLWEFAKGLQETNAKFAEAVDMRQRVKAPREVAPKASAKAVTRTA